MSTWRRRQPARAALVATPEGFEVVRTPIMGDRRTDPARARRWSQVARVERRGDWIRLVGLDGDEDSLWFAAHGRWAIAHPWSARRAAAAVEAVRSARPAAG